MPKLLYVHPPRLKAVCAQADPEIAETPEALYTAMDHLKALRNRDDLESVRISDTVRFHAELELESFHTSRVKVWEQTYDNQGDAITRDDLSLHTELFGKTCSITFSSQYFDSDQAFERLHNALSKSVEVAAIAEHNGTGETVLFRLVALTAS
ncbi:MAG TPA: hypothetical protein ENL04_04870 [Sulfuricurvum sp.]|nr:hypothetical protein [Sulfuricurvum sp.]